MFKCLFQDVHGCSVRLRQLKCNFSPVCPAAFFLILKMKLKEMQQPILLYIKPNEVYFHLSVCARTHTSDAKWQCASRLCAAIHRVSFGSVSFVLRCLIFLVLCTFVSNSERHRLHLPNDACCLRIKGLKRFIPF